MSVGEGFTLAAYLTGAAVFWWAARRRRVDTEGMAWLLLAGLCFGVLGARLAEWTLGAQHMLLTHPDSFLDPTTGGRTIVGGILSGWFGVEVAKRRLGIRRSTGDLFALALPAGEIFGRIGCYFNGCCYGMPCSLPWAVYQHGTWRHPSQLYMSAMALGTLCLMLWLRSRVQEPGTLFKLYLGAYCACRFVAECFRERDILAAGLSLAQIVCLVVLSYVVVNAWQGGWLRATRLRTV